MNEQEEAFAGQRAEAEADADVAVQSAPASRSVDELRQGVEWVLSELAKVEPQLAETLRVKFEQWRR